MQRAFPPSLCPRVTARCLEEQLAEGCSACEEMLLSSLPSEEVHQFSAVVTAE